MRKTFYYLTLCLSFCLVSCSFLDDQYKKDIVGTYSYVDIQNQDNVIMNEAISRNFKSDMSVDFKSVLTITMVDETYGKVSLKYKLSFVGAYDIKDSYLIEKYDANSFEIKYIKSDDYRVNALAKEFGNIMDESVIPKLKNDFKYIKSYILTIDNAHIELENGDSKIIYNRESSIDILNELHLSNNKEEPEFRITKDYMVKQLKDILKNEKEMSIDLIKGYLGDLNDDNVQDGLLSYSQCINGGNFCVQSLMVFYSVDNQVYYVDIKTSELINSQRGGAFQINKISKGIIYASIFTYADEDPECCPSIEENSNFKLVENKLVQVY